MQFLKFTARLSVEKVEAALSSTIAGYRFYLFTNDLERGLPSLLLI
jgi:hypothetical protein